MKALIWAVKDDKGNLLSLCHNRRHARWARNCWKSAGKSVRLYAAEPSWFDYTDMDAHVHRLMRKEGRWSMQ